MNSSDLSGWAAFRALRRSPAPIPTRRHGNWRHGRYSRARIEGMREFRRCVKMIRHSRRTPDHQSL